MSYPRGLNMDHAEDIMAVANDILSRQPYPYAVYAGQLLSMYRQYEIAPHSSDTDLDFAVLLPREGDTSGWKKVLRQNFYAEGFLDGPKEGTIEDGSYRAHQECFHRDGCLVDIITYQPTADPSVIFNLNAHGKKTLPARLFDVHPFLFKGVTYPMLWPAVEYCELVWGKGWRTPKESKGSWMAETQTLAPGRDWI